MDNLEVFKKNDEMIVREIDDETVLMPLFKSSEDLNCIYSLNPMATYVWKRIDGERSLVDIKKEILNDFDSSEEEVDEELKTLFSDFKEINALLP